MYHRALGASSTVLGFLAGAALTVGTALYSPTGSQTPRSASLENAAIYPTAAQMERDPVWSFQTKNGIISALAFSPDGRRLAGGSYNGRIGLWNTRSGRLERTLPAKQDAVTSLAFSPDGRWLAVGHYGKAVYLWNVSRGRL